VADLIIFDFDGVIADSEVLANTVLAEMLTELGAPTTLEQSYDRYMGKRSPELMAALEAAMGKPLPAGFLDDFQARSLARFDTDLRPVPGALAFIDAFAHVPQCIASSSTPSRLAGSLDALGLTDHFGANVFSATMVARGKPHPDIFLHAAEKMTVPPARCIVLEDSPSGVAAGVAAGMTVIGLTAAAHIRDGDRERLLAAGAHDVADTFEAATAMTRRFFEDLAAG